MSEDKSDMLGTCDKDTCEYILHSCNHAKLPSCANWKPLPSSEGTVKHRHQCPFCDNNWVHLVAPVTCILSEMAICHQCEENAKQEEANQSAASASGESSAAKFSGSAEPQPASSERRQSASEVLMASVPLKSETVPLGYSGIIDGINKLDGHIRYLEKAPSVLIGRVKSETVSPSEQLIIDLARELYDKFVMGGWLPSDAHQMIREMLAIPSETVPTESVCDICGGVNPVWFAANPVWNEIVPERSGFICPICFIARAEKQGYRNTGWQLVPENHDIPVETVPTEAAKPQEFDSVLEREIKWHTDSPHPNADFKAGFLKALQHVKALHRRLNS